MLKQNTARHHEESDYSQSQDGADKEIDIFGEYIMCYAHGYSKQVKIK